VNVQIVLEDTPNDQHIAVPIIRAIFQYIQRPAKVAVLKDRMGSVEQATNLDRLRPLLAARCGMVDLFILIVDRDCRAPNRPRGGDRNATLRNLEQRVKDSGALGKSCRFIACEAIEELEVWLLAGFEHEAWQPIREHCDLKEEYFEPFAKGRGVFEQPGEGRAELMAESIGKYKRIRQLCEELQHLEVRIQGLLAGAS